MAQQAVQLQRLQSGYDNEGLQQLQRELNQEQINLQRMTSEEERADRRKMREVFESVRIIQDKISGLGISRAIKGRKIFHHFSWIQTMTECSIYVN